MWVVIKIMVPFWVPIIIRPLIFRVPQKGTIILITTHVEARMSGWISSRLFLRRTAAGDTKTKKKDKWEANDVYEGQFRV